MLGGKVDTGPATGSFDEKARQIDLIRRTIQELRDLPTLPLIAVEVRRLASDPNKGVAQLVEVVEEDVALTSRILRIANSPYYGVPRKISNLKMAMVILGMREIINLVTTISVVRLFPDRGGHPFDLQTFWKHSAATAELTSGLVEALRIPSSGSAYIAGLLHDIGKLVLSQFFRDQFVQSMNLSQEQKIPLPEAELRVIGVDHGHVGSWLIQRWNIPEEIGQAVAQHHIRPPTAPAHSLPVVIDWADRIEHLFENRTVEEVTAELAGNPHWLSWYGEQRTLLPDLVSRFKVRLDRSIMMMGIL
jgi:putative nucleotidyltransferase with HDIG domain